MVDSWDASNVKFLRERQPKGTRNAYDCYWKQFKRFCDANDRCAIPASTATAIMFMRVCLKAGLSRSVINKSVVSAINDAHEVVGLQAPLAKDFRQVILTKRAVTRNTRPPKSKNPLTTKHLIRMASKIRVGSSTDTRDFLSLLLMFAGLLREAEVVSLKTTETWIHQENGKRFLCLYVGGADSESPTKTDQGRHGELIVLAENTVERLLCPVAWFQRYTRMRQDHMSPFLMVDFLRPDKLHQLSKELPNTIMKRWIARIGENPQDFSSHSGRHGGATAAAEMGVAERLLQKHGRWRSLCVRAYIHESLTARLSVSEAILAHQPDTLHQRIRKAEGKT